LRVTASQAEGRESGLLFAPPSQIADMLGERRFETESRSQFSTQIIDLRGLI